MTDQKIEKARRRTRGVVVPEAEAPTELPANELARADLDNALKTQAGSDNPRFNFALIRAVLGTRWAAKDDKPESRGNQVGAMFSAMEAFKPTDEIEGMLAAQAVAMHLASMECFRRAMIPDQPAEFASKLRKDGANLSRAMTDMLDALDRKRGKAPQVVRVERVVVHEGGQAVVGNVRTGDGGQ